MGRRKLARYITKTIQANIDCAFDLNETNWEDRNGVLLTSVEARLFVELIEKAKSNTSAIGLNIPCVMGSLPPLITKEYPNEWIASLDGIRGMVATGETEDEAINQLMISVKVMLLYNRQ